MITDVSKNREPYFDGVPICHPCYIISFTLTGTGQKIAGDKTIPLTPGTVVCTPPNVMQQSFSKDGMQDIVIYASQFTIGQKDGPRLLVLQDDDTNTARMLFQLLYNIFQQRNIFLDSFLKNVYKNLLQFLETRYVQSLYDPRIIAITRHLHALFTQDALSVERILASQGQNTDYLRRLFKKTHGCTPIQYLNLLRIGQAKRLLEGNSIHHYTITEIAQRSGFSDASYFSRVFRTHIGLTPSQYEQLFPGTDPAYLSKK